MGMASLITIDRSLHGIEGGEPSSVISPNTYSSNTQETKAQVKAGQDSGNELIKVNTTTSAERQPMPTRTPAAVLHAASSPKPKLPPRSADNSEYLLRDLAQAKQDLARFHAKARVDIERKDQELNEIRQQADADLRAKEQERDEFYKRWKQATSELNKILAQSQGFFQVTDQELIQKTTQLRYNIRNFADQHFVGEVRDAKGVRSFCASSKEYLDVSPESLEALMRSSSKHAIVIKAYLWAFLAKDIFGRFCWAGTQTSRAMSYLTDILKPDDNGDSFSPDAKRKFQLWRANTTTLLIDADDSDKDDDHGAHRKNNEKKIQEICQNLRPFAKASERDLADQVFNIVMEALIIDKMISKQVAEVTWLFDYDMARGERRASDVQNVWLVVAPGMIKRGKSTGEDFNVGNTLLEREVWYEPRASDSAEENHRATTGSLINRARGVWNTRK